MTLRQGLNQVREKPLPLGVFRNSTLLAPTRSSCSGDQLCLLSRRNLMDRSSENLERTESFSHYNISLTFGFLFSPSLILFSQSIWSRLGSRGLVTHCHMSNPYWPPQDYLYPLPIYHGFPSNGMMSCVSHGFHLSSCLTCSRLDTWLNVSHPTLAMCHPTPYASKNV